MLRFKNHLSERFKSHRDISQAEGRTYQHYADLLWRLKNGDHSAWEYFVTEWGARVYSYLRYNTKSEDDAQNILSEVMLTLVHEVPHYEGDTTLATFVFTLAYRKLFAYWHKFGKASGGVHSAPVLQEDGGNRRNSGSQETALHKIWMQLEEHAQQALLLQYHAGLTINEIADVLGRPYDSTEYMLGQLHRQFQNLFLGSARA